MSSVFGTRYGNCPVLGWSFNDVDDVKNIISQATYDLYYQNYSQVFVDVVAPIFGGGAFKIDFGGKESKNRLIAVDRPLGVFNFALASKGLYEKKAYYSEQLAKEHPDRFADLELPIGIVPPNLVDTFSLAGVSKFYFNDNVLGKQFECVLIPELNKLGEKQYASKTKKVYNTYSKSGGKVKYVELYSLFYFTGFDNELQYAIRHIPALMVANYLEGIGVKTKIFMTRFVLLDGSQTPMPKVKKDIKLYELMKQDGIRTGYPQESLFIQPYPAKEYGQDLNFKECLMMARKDSSFYAEVARAALQQETSNNPAIYGNPDSDQQGYLEGFERYKQKYLTYTKQGIWEGKEVTADTMIFFHDMSLKGYLSSFLKTMDAHCRAINSTIYRNQTQAILHPDVNEFFNWWMVVCANTIKHKFDLLNSKNRNKTIREIGRELEEYVFKVDAIINNTQNQNLKNSFSNFKNFILRRQGIYNVNDELDLTSYILALTDEFTVYSQGVMFATPQEEVEKRDAFVESVLTELLYI